MDIKINFFKNTVYIKVKIYSALKKKKKYEKINQQQLNT